MAIAQGVCLYRLQCGIEGPLFVGINTDALSRPALATALEVLVANGVITMIDYQPYPGSIWLVVGLRVYRSAGPIQTASNPILTRWSGP